MPAQRHSEKTIAFVLYPGLTPFDLAGPLQVVTQLAVIRPEIRPVVVGERIEPMATDIGARMIPEKTFGEVPHPYALVVPGGAQPTRKAMSNQAIRGYVRTAAETAEIVGSVCTGALILASVGLLEGRQAAPPTGRPTRSSRASEPPTGARGRSRTESSSPRPASRRASTWDSSSPPG